MIKFWNPLPIHTALIELLEKKNGISTDKELYEELKIAISDLSFNAVHKTLMKLELEGLIRVSSLLRDTKQVELLLKD